MGDIVTKQKKKYGFSYIEVIIAMALFAVAMLAVIPALSQAARNMFFAQETAAGHHQAQHLMLAIRDAIGDEANLEAHALAIASGDFEYSVWIMGQHHDYFSSHNAPVANVGITGISHSMSTRTSTIVVIVWGEDEQIIGRAIGMTDFYRSEA